MDGYSRASRVRKQVLPLVLLSNEVNLPRLDINFAETLNIPCRPQSPKRARRKLYVVCGYRREGVKSVLILNSEFPYRTLDADHVLF